MIEGSNINHLIHEWSGKRQYQIHSQYKGKNIQNILMSYEQILSQVHVDIYDDFVDFWTICELFMSFSLSLE